MDKLTPRDAENLRLRIESYRLEKLFEWYVRTHYSGYVKDLIKFNIFYETMFISSLRRNVKDAIQIKAQWN